MSEVLRFADEYFDAVERGDIDAVAACYHDDVAVWHSFDNLDQSKAENLAAISGSQGAFDELRFTEIRTVELPDGFLRQHVVVARRGDRETQVPGILRVYVTDRSIHRIEEYVDPSQLMSVLA